MEIDDARTKIFRPERTWTHVCKFAAYLSFYSLIMLCLWPILLLTPFIFGCCIMCHIDPGLEFDHPMKTFMRYWAAFMSAKVIIGMTVVTVCDLIWKPEPQPASDLNEADDDEGDDNNKERDAYNNVSFTAMNICGILVIIFLIFGMNSIITQIVRMMTWFIIYIWLTAWSIKQIIPIDQRVMNYSSLFQIHTWINSNMLHTKFQTFDG